jgi:glycosyltransferase involved in cell wall biosynthesis
MSQSYKPLLYMCEYPPSTQAGAPVIAKQLLAQYDQARLQVLCCEEQYENRNDVVKDSYLSCEHTTIPTVTSQDLRPRRVFVPIKHTLNCLRTPRILREARRIVEEKNIQAIFTIPWRCEFALAAYYLHRETGIPLYVFETDDWLSMNPHLLQGHLIKKHRQDFLESASQLWVTSPNMQRRYRERFGVDSEFLFHFVDVDAYQAATKAVGSRASAEQIRVVYTGSINRMFYDTMKTFCDLLNDGLTVDDRPVVMDVYGGGCPSELQGPAVTYRGLVDLREIPGILANADLSFVGVTFSEDPDLRELVKTSLYTKTIDYLASGRPVLVVSPPDTGEVNYFGDVTHVVTDPSPTAMRDALDTIIRSPETTAAKTQAGLDLVRSRHSLDSLHKLFLKHFVGAISSEEAAPRLMQSGSDPVGQMH